MLKESRTSAGVVGTLPNFLIIGAQRSGSTALATHLRAHPEVFMPDRKELRFFDDNFDRGREWYQRQFREAADQPAIGEATPNYMYQAEAIDRMAYVVPKARLIAILRNPVDRAYSHYWMNRVRGYESLEFGEAIAAEPRRLASGDPSARIGQSYLDRGRYHQQLLHVSRYFPRESLHVIVLEDLWRAPAETYRRVCRFIGATLDFSPPNLGAPIGHFVELRSRTLFRINKKLPRPLRRVGGRMNARKAPYPPMDPALRADLVESFRDENDALAAWLGRDLSVWRS